MEIFRDPWLVACILAMPLVIIGLAKSWKRFRDKYAEKHSQTPKEGES